MDEQNTSKRLNTIDLLITLIRKIKFASMCQIYFTNVFYAHIDRRLKIKTFCVVLVVYKEFSEIKPKKLQITMTVNLLKLD